MSVAVVARGDFRSHGRFSKRHRLAVIGLAIMFKTIFVAFAATRIARHFEMPVLRRLDIVRRVTIRANRSTLIAFRQQLSVNTLVVNLLDA